MWQWNVAVYCCKARWGSDRLTFELLNIVALGSEMFSQKEGTV